MAAFGKRFNYEIEQAGLLGLPFTWDTETGDVYDELLTPEQRATLAAVIAAHDPNAVHPEDTRVGTFKNDATQQDLLNRLKTATPAQIDAWLTTNVTNLAQARTVLGAIIKFIVARRLY